MKLIKKVFLVALVLGLLTGCSKTRTLTCNDKNDEAKMKVVAKLKNNKIKDIKLTIEMEIESNEEKRQMLTYLKLYKQQMNPTLTEHGIRLTAGMSSSYFDAFNLTKDTSYDELKQMLELQGYTCE